MPDLGEICEGVNGIFLVGCHSEASFGFMVCKSLNPVRIALLEQYGQLFPLALLEICACHSCPHLPNHQTFLLERAETIVGLRLPFLVGCHSEASLGFIVCKSLKPARIALLEQ